MTAKKIVADSLQREVDKNIYSIITGYRSKGIPQSIKLKKMI
ncbi:MAG: hypothetical protein Q4F66_02355 [Clostridium sp.]|nr:hypothetical protein [Clostridium sp.]